MQTRDGKRRGGQLAAHEAHDLRVDVDDGELRDRRRGAEAPDGTVNRQRRQVVVAENEDATPDESVRLVQCEHATELRLDGAVALVEIEARRRCRPRRPGDVPDDRSESAGDDDLTPAAARARGAGRQAERARREEPASARGQLGGTAFRDDRPLAELAADGGDDRNGKLRGAAQASDRDRLESRQCGEHRSHAALALGQTDCVRDLAHDAEPISQRRAAGR